MSFKERLEKILVQKGFAESEVNEEELVAGIPNNFVVSYLSEDWGNNHISKLLIDTINDLIESESLQCESLNKDGDKIEEILTDPDVIDTSVIILKDFEDEIYEAYEE